MRAETIKMLIEPKTSDFGRLELRYNCVETVTVSAQAIAGIESDFIKILL